MKTRKFFTATGVVAVASVAGAISYRHQQHLSATHGQTHALSLIWPLCVDGLVTVTAIAMSTDRAAGLRPRLWALFGFWIGVIVSVATNWLATSGGVINHAVSAFPALAFLLAIESLSAKARAPRKRRTGVKAAPVVTSDDAPAPVPARAESAVKAASPVTSNDVPAPAKTTRPRARTAPSVRPSSRDAVASAARKMPNATTAQIAARAGVSEPTARRHLNALATSVEAAQAPAGDVIGDAADALGTAPFDLFPDVTTTPVRVNGHDVMAEVTS